MKAQQKATKLKPRNTIGAKVLTPLGIIASFVSLTEAIAGIAAVQTTGGVQVALIAFVCAFPLMVAAAFFAILWHKPHVLYPPADFGSHQDVTAFALAMRGRVTDVTATAERGKVVEDQSESARLTETKEERDQRQLRNVSEGDSSTGPVVESQRTTADVEMQMFDAYGQGDTAEGKRLFDQIIEREKDPVKRSEHEIRNAYLQVIYTHDSAAIDTLKALSTQPAVASLAYAVLGSVYEQHKDFQSAISADKRALETAAEKDKARRVARLADAYSQNAQSDVGIRTLISALPTFHEARDRAVIFDELASIYEQSQNHEMRAISLDLALQATPLDMSLRFKAALAYSNGGLHDLALLHYYDDVSLNPKAVGAWNNLGVEFEHFDLPIKAVSSYRQSLEQNNSLAGANLGFRFLDAGFFTEAKAVLDEAKRLEDVHQNVASAIAALTQRSDAEEQSKKDILTRADQEQRFFRGFGDAYFSDCLHSFSGNWRSEDGEVIPIDTVDGKLSGSWLHNARKKELTGAVNGCSANVTITSEPETGFLASLDRVKSSAHAYLDEAGTRCLTMFIEKGSPTFAVWTRA